MKTFMSLTLCLLTVSYGIPLTARANVATEVYLLPESRAGEPYESDIEAVLRDKYRLKVETSRSESILQWFLLDGELPPGLTVRTNGTVIGTPSAYRAQPYQFRVRIVDQSASKAEQLVIPLSMAVEPPGLRLARIDGPSLVRYDEAPATRGAGSKGPSEPVIEEQFAARESVATGISARARPVFATARPNVNTLPQSSGTDDTKPQGCEKRGVRKAVSDEAHTPLEGDTSTQNTCVQFKNLNTLKYRIEFSNKTTRTEGPDISSLPFLPKLTLTGTSAPTQAGTAAPTEDTAPVIALSKRIDRPADAKAKIKSDFEKLDERFNKVAKGLNDAETYIRTNIEEPINVAVTAIQDAHKKSVRLANSADFYLQSNNVSGLLTEVGETKALVDPALRKTWPTQEITKVLNNLGDLALALESLRLDPLSPTRNQDVTSEAWAAWLAANQDKFNRVKDRIAELTGKVNTTNNGVTAFNEAKNVLADWQLIINNVDNQKAAAFQQEAFVSCHTDEGEGKSSKLTMSKSDRTVSNSTAVTREVLTVNCYSRVAFTAGFNFSSLDEKEFSVVESAGSTPDTTVKKFGFTNRSSFRPSPLALLNIRFTDYAKINWHASFGAVVDLKGQTGTDVEPIAGVSFSIRRLIFITPFAVHFGRVNKLAGDFKEGDVVPDGIATPPIEKAWKVGYTGGVTFRIGPQ
jgi:hypothetical protein